MEFKGTKGKWKFDKDVKTTNVLISDGFYLGEIRNKYDALLISKAPEMLEMLKQVVILFELGKLRSIHGVNDLIKEATEL